MTNWVRACPLDLQICDTVLSGDTDWAAYGLPAQDALGRGVRGRKRGGAIQRHGRFAKAEVPLRSSSVASLMSGTQTRMVATFLEKAVVACCQSSIRRIRGAQSEELCPMREGLERGSAFSLYAA